jgi:hypothetical protein
MFSREMNPSLGRSGRVRPQLEILEDRCCPSGVSLHNHVLSLTGDSSNSTIIVRDGGQGNISAQVEDGSGHWHSLAANGVSTIDIDSHGGNDRIEYDLTHTLTTSETLNLNLGKGNDQVRLNFDQKISARSLKINVDGGGGNPDILAAFGNIDGTDLQLAARLGNSWNHFDSKWGGGGHFYAKFNGNETGNANVKVNIQGGDGVSGINVKVNGDIGKYARMTVNTTVGNNDNTVHVDYTGKLDGSLTIEDHVGSGWDWLESHINLTPHSTGSLVVHLHGGSRSDPLILSVRDSGSHLKKLDATITGAAGDTTINHTGNVKVLNPHH